MIIDFHVHVGKSEKSKFRYFSFEEYIHLMNKCGVDKLVAMPNVSSEISWDIMNDEHLISYYNIKDKSVGRRFYPFILVDPLVPETYTQISIHEKYLYGLKYHPSTKQIPVDDTRMYKFFDAATERNWPIIVHCGRDPISNIHYLIEAAKKFPTKFVAAHMGGNAADLIDNAIEAVAESKLDNIWLDTSSGKCPWLIERAVNSLGHHRLLFGSDEPYADMRISIKLIELADISTEAKEHILYKNAMSILD